ncbi:MAG TPA: S8 family serine peptidase [Gaiellaceae bacterium]|nr:S8 family serine peptidase [Gaiellaceae bacterium]
MRRSLLPLALALAAVLSLLASGGAAAPSRPSGNLVEVVVTLPRPSLAVELGRNRTLAAAARRRHSVDVAAAASVSYLRTLAAAQRTFTARLAVDVPSARVHWRYGVALDGVSVVLPSSELARLRAVPGATVWPTVTYHDLRDTTHAAAVTATAQPNPGPTLIGATSLWGPSLASAGQGIKIGIVDDGIDQAHSYFDASSFAYPVGFPKGDTAYTTPKVIVARAFPAPSTRWRFADRPFDPKYSFHATHVAGIAAGDYDTRADTAGVSLVSGVAPKAYLGNYKALTVPTQGFGLDGNSPEIAKAIDQAVADGMNVINLSIGEPEVEPRRDIVVQALDNAAAAGVVPVVAAGNDFDAAGLGSIGSPANTPAAITVAASTLGGGGTRPDVIASFSSAGPTPVSLLPKPDVSAPGVGIVSSLPPNDFGSLDGTSMATPHVAGAASLLLQRHPAWTVSQVKSALASTAEPLHPSGRSGEITVLREGGGRIDLVRADQPLLFTDPTSLGWSLVRRGFSSTKQISTTDAGGGSAPWNVSVDASSMPRGATLSPLATTLVAGASLSLRLAVSRTASAGDGTGFVVFTRGGDTRRVSFWFHVEVPRLGLDPHRTLSRPGLYRGNTSGKASRVSAYRYPERGFAVGVPTRLGGPEQVFRFTLRKRVANFGVVVVSRAQGVRVSPRLVAGGDENRLVGYTGLPASLNPYQEFGRPEPVVAAVLADPGTYDFVFDTPTGAKPGAFRFRFWVNDTSPPSIRLLDRTAIAGRLLRLAVHDPGSGVDRRALRVKVDGKAFPFFTYSGGVLSIRTEGLSAGKHSLAVTASDHQETKNMEDVGPVLPNTRVLQATVTLRR